MYRLLLSACVVCSLMCPFSLAQENSSPPQQSAGENLQATARLARPDAAQEKQKQDEKQQEDEAARKAAAKKRRKARQKAEQKAAQKQAEKSRKSQKAAESQKADKSEEQPKSEQLSDQEKELTLENLFPEKGLFGPGASRPAFSTDGRFAAWLYRPRVERRHGSDVWLYDFETGRQTRLTNVVMFSEYRKSARAVRDDRLKKAKKTAAGSEKKEDDDAQKKDKDADKKDAEAKGKDKQNKQKQKQELSQEQILEIVMQVSDKDADDEKAPRYDGVSSFSWHPEKNSMLLSAGGDVYQIEDVLKPKLVRLTSTQSRESRVEYLPDGSGYTYSDDDVVHRVTFGVHLVEQINPKLGSGERLSGYAISPNGQRLVLVARTGSGRPTSTRQVDYIRYRDRFAKAATVSRTVSDDKTEPLDVAVYLFDLQKALTEDAELVEIFRTKIDDPRDVISTPEWAPDSSKVTFYFFDQKNSEAQIRIGEFPEAAAANSGGADKASEVAAASGADGDETAKSNEARVVYRFRHFGGPNTPRMIAPEFAWDSHQVVFVSEQTGFRHVHMLDPLYETVRPLTAGQFEVYPLRMSKDHRLLFVTSTKDSSAREMVYSVDLASGEMKRLSKEDGTYSSVAVSNDGRRLVGRFSTYGKLPELIRQDEKQTVEQLTDSHSAAARHFTQARPEFFEYKNRHGHTIKGMMFKPEGWKKSQKRPLLIYVYGGPLGTRKSVVDGSYSSSGYFFNNYMAQKHGYLTVVIDPRGQSGYGAVFEKANYKRVGRPQVEDLVDGVKFLTAEFNADKKKVGIYGWSFGGFQTQMCLYTAPDVFQVGIAGAGPTEWENYNSWYTTGTVGPSGTEKPDQKKYSLRPLAKNLKGKLLLIHGIEDTNVLFQDTIAIYRELLKAGKETNVELFLDPTGSHGLGGDVKRLNRYRKYEDFLLRTLGAGPQAKKAG